MRKHIGALWRRTGKKSGKEYWAGELIDPQTGEVFDIVIFPNTFRRTSKEPDLLIFEQMTQTDYKEHLKEQQLRKALRARNMPAPFELEPQIEEAPGGRPWTQQSAVPLAKRLRESRRLAGRGDSG